MNQPGRMQNEHRYLQICLEMIGQSLQWGDSVHWGNHDLQKLSDRIFEKTKVRLSVSTLKRLWGKVQYTSSPAFHTLDALAQFLDFKDWRDFQSQTDLQTSRPLVDAETAAPTPAIQKPKRSVTRIAATVTLATLATAFIGGMLIAGKENPRAGYAFKAHKVSNDLPNSVVFDYSVPGDAPHKVFIQQSWDPEKRKMVLATDHQHTSIYFRPGYFHAKLLVDGMIVKEDTVFIQTKGWKAIIEQSPMPVYLSAAETAISGGLGVKAATLRGRTGITVLNEFWTSFSNVHDFKMDGNDIDFNTSVKNTSTVEESLCRRVKIALLGKDGAVIIPLATMGCISAIDLGTNGVGLRGSEHDLSGFGCSFHDFEKIRCTIKNQTINIWHNGKLVHQSPQPHPIGDVIGIRVSFEGAGVIQSVTLGRSGSPPIELISTGK